VSNSLTNGREFKCLRVVDDLSHEYVEIAVNLGISGQYFARLFNQVAIF
jgi:putative transposase